MNPSLILIDDLHLEGRESEDYIIFAKEINNEIDNLKNKGMTPILICAGDIAEGIEGVKWVSQFKVDIIYICGNHEFWSNDYFEVLNNIKDFVAKSDNNHIKFLHNESVVIQGIKFIGSTLWTGIGQDLPWNKKNHIMRFYVAMGDFKKITATAWYTPENKERLKEILSEAGVEEERIYNLIGNHLFNPLLEQEINSLAIKFLKSEIEMPFGGEKVVVTHHLPSYEIWLKEKGLTLEDIEGEFINNERKFFDAVKGNNQKFKDIMMLGFYANNLKTLMCHNDSPNYWLHGHLHDGIEEVLGKTKIISSPTGYKKQSESLKFKIIDMKNNDFSKNYVIKEINNFNWGYEISNNLKDLENAIISFDNAIATKLLNYADFEPILKCFKKNHTQNLRNLRTISITWLQALNYKEDIANDFYSIKKQLNIFDYKAESITKIVNQKFKFPDNIEADINEFSFLEKESFDNKCNLPHYHYEEWLKEIQKIQFQIIIYKQFLLDFCNNYKNN